MNRIMDYKAIIIGVDHGYGNIKTAHRIISSGVDRIEGEAITQENILHYGNSYYSIGESHLTFLGEKTKDQGFYILTLAAIAEELNYRGMSEANIILSAGLPLAWTASQSKEFKRYLIQDREPEFDYKGIHYHVYISRVMIFPQGFAEINSIGNITGEGMIVDVGNGTMNIMRVSNGNVLEKSLVTENYGVSICVRNIQEAVSRAKGRNIDERILEGIIRSESPAGNDEITGLARRIAKEYAAEILKRLVVHGYEEEYMNLYVFGGGGCLLRNFTDISEKKNVTFIDDLCANAKGFEFLAIRKMDLITGRTA